MIYNYVNILLCILLSEFSPIVSKGFEAISCSRGISSSYIETLIQLEG